MHLTAEEFIDVIEGARAEASLRHLLECRACQDQLAAIRGTFSAATDAEVPEPSALFWPRFSAQLRERIDADDRRAGWRNWTRPRVLVPASAVAVFAILVAVFVSPHRPPPDVAARIAMAPPAEAPGAVDVADEPSFDLAADPSLTLVADLTAGLDWDAAAVADFAGRGSAEHAVTHMDADELRALRRLLQEELGHTGA